jgi:hypothetical protein
VVADPDLVPDQAFLTEVLSAELSNLVS